MVSELSKMMRAPTYDGRGMKKGAWSKEEDDKLRAYILKYGHWNWAQLPKFAGINKSHQVIKITSTNIWELYLLLLIIVV